jgi:hypothetical protein
VLVHGWLLAVDQINQTGVIPVRAEGERRPLNVFGLAGGVDSGLGVDVESVVDALEDGAGDVSTVVDCELRYISQFLGH